MARSSLRENPDFQADCRSEMKKKDIMAKWSCGSSVVVNARKDLGVQLDTAREKGEAPAGESEKHNPDGSADFVRFSATAWGYEDYRDFIRKSGMDPDEVTFSWGWTSNPGGGFWNKLNNVRPIVPGQNGVLAWPLVEPARTQYVITVPEPVERENDWKVAILGADPQIGFDMDPEGNLVPYHDDAAIDIFNQIVALENPDQVVIAGDIIDLAEQGRWAKEARFAHTTQPALERTRRLAADLRARCSGEIHFIEGNHDKRMQHFMETNALASQGLRRAGHPEEPPVMSLPFLLGLSDYDVNYVDAYPAATHWITDGLRAIHGTRANSKGSTMSQYANDTPHISTVAGHSHRLEMQSKTTFDRAGKIRTMAINPGCLCRVDGMVPSVHGARHLDGSKATWWEDWQQGVAVIHYKDTGEFFVDLVQIDEGRTIYKGRELVAVVD